MVEVSIGDEKTEDSDESEPNDGTDGNDSDESDTTRLPRQSHPIPDHIRVWHSNDGSLNESGRQQYDDPPRDSHDNIPKRPKTALSSVRAPTSSGLNTPSCRPHIKSACMSPVKTARSPWLLRRLAHQNGCRADRGRNEWLRGHLGRLRSTRTQRNSG